MKKYFEIEFFYRSSDLEHLRQLRLLETALLGVPEYTVNFRKTDVDSSFVPLPEGIPGLPCIRRIAPTPERIILGILKTETDVWTVLGMSPPKIPLDTDRFTGWGTPRSKPQP
jgi:hypothetical protein